MISDWREDYNWRRPHSSLGMKARPCSPPIGSPSSYRPPPDRPDHPARRHAGGAAASAPRPPPLPRAALLPAARAGGARRAGQIPNAGRTTGRPRSSGATTSCVGVKAPRAPHPSARRRPTATTRPKWISRLLHISFAARCRWQPLSVAQLIERYAERWPTEVTYEEGTEELAGVGEARNRARKSPSSGPSPSSSCAMTLTFIWYALSGHHPADVDEHRQRSPWCPTKTTPSFADMLAKLRRVIIAGQFHPGRGCAPPSPRK